MKHFFKLFIYIFFSFVVITFLISLYQKVPNEDEAIIAAHAHHLNDLGYVKSDLYSGYGYGWDKRMYFFHKLFVYAGALAEKIGGFNIMAFKCVSLIFFIALLFSLYKYMKIKNNDAINVFLLTVALFSTHFLIFDYAFMYRPEIMMVFFGFASFFLLETRKTKNENIVILISGFLAGLSASTHLNGLIYCAAGGLSLLLFKEWKNAVLFGINGFLGISIYFLDILSVEELTLWKEQFFNDPNVLEKPSALVSLLNEHMRFFWDFRDASFSILFFFLLIVNFKRLKEKHSFLLIYFLLLVVSLGLLAHGKTTKYATAYFPFMAIVCAESIHYYFSKKTWLQLPILVLVLVYATVHFKHNFKVIGEHINIEARNKKIAQFLPEKNVKLCAPAVFVFNEIDDYIIRGPVAFGHYYITFHSDERTLEKFMNFSYKNGDEYIVIDAITENKPYMVDLQKLNSLSINDVIGGYKLTTHQNDFWIFERI